MATIVFDQVVNKEGSGSGGIDVPTPLAVLPLCRQIPHVFFFPDTTSHPSLSIIKYLIIDKLVGRCVSLMSGLQLPVTYQDGTYCEVRGSSQLWISHGHIFR